MLTSGQLLAERYRLDRRIAVGGMGEVWQAVDVRLDRSVAVKVLKPELCGDAEFLHRFRTEARTTASLNHPGIAAVHDYGETASIPDGPEDTAYLVMELVEGEPLAAILAREGRITTEHTMEMLEQAGNALQAAHERGLVHRDVKPGNIMVGPTGTVKLTDFGIAKAADAAPVTRSGMVMGTAHYIAPEQALGSEATPSSDVYSLAVVGYECLRGHRPFLSENAVTVAMMHIREIAAPLPPDVAPGARAVIEATLVKDPRRRYAGGGEFANAVASVRAGLPLPTPAALAVPQQHFQQRPVPQPVQPPVQQPPPSQQFPASAAATGVNPLPTPAPPGQPTTQPPGAVPPQNSVRHQNPPGPAPPPGQPVSAGRAGLWVLLAVVVVVVLVIVGFAVAITYPRSSPAPGPAASKPAHLTTARQGDTVRFLGLDSTYRLSQNALRHPGSAGENSHSAREGHRTCRSTPTTERIATKSPGTAYRALVPGTSAVTDRGSA
ncbi:serine/threonine-protein kinase [Saccharopolyspora lacisalsi]|uniref:non-specific serine/threonine protein kinase n=1 Tax=Halosaccharopolyspora lacisalsi TaxID=1000566 RepID=A0A839E901_9PSEU|nr:serine/threonine-protein kinase [Halosaccharopolyspora lacisalsi]MBA8827635.1 serine/threonine-protein kinase [Halosaccharopolyspora lacisalsi]MBA8827751.1 serine/threonine-protein kinase [Halosaccharopolyspora lacisalsi]